MKDCVFHVCRQIIARKFNLQRYGFGIVGTGYQEINAFIFRRNPNINVAKVPLYVVADEQFAGVERKERLQSCTSRERGNRSTPKGVAIVKTPTPPAPRGMTSKRPRIGRQQAEADGAAPVAVVDPVDHGRQFLPFLLLEQIGLMAGGRDQIEQYDADRKRLVPRGAGPEPVETGEQKAGVARLMEIELVPSAAEIADP
jgi:hypothetical protein